MSARGFAAVLIILASSRVAWPQPAPLDPWPDRPRCISYILKEDRRLSFRQKACDWIQNRVFSQDAAIGAAWSAGFSQFRERTSDRGKGTTGFTTRFATNFAQSSVKSTGAYLGGMVFREDPRRVPPYVHRRKLRGFWPRLGRALQDPLIAYRCTGSCTQDEEVSRVFALSRVAGAFASGYSSMLWAPDRLNTPGRALRRTASAYGGNFSSSVFNEFKPELTALVGGIARALGVR